MGIDYATSHDAVRAGRQLLDAARAALAQLKELHDRVRELHAELVADAAQRSLDDLDLATMREVTSATHLHLAPLRAAGLQTVGDVLRAPASQLDRLPGLGPARVRAIRLAAEALATAATAAQVVRLDPQHPTRAADLLVTALAQALLLGEPGRELTQWEALTGVRLASALDDALPAANRLRWTLAGRRGRELAGAAAARVLELVDASPQAAQAADRVLHRGPALKPRQAWQQFTQSGADYYAELERLTGAAAPRSRQLGGLASEVAPLARSTTRRRWRLSNASNWTSRCWSVRCALTSISGPGSSSPSSASSSATRWDWARPSRRSPRWPTWPPTGRPTSW